MHKGPLGLPEQSTQAEDEPHAVGAPPSWHIPIEPPQQKPAPQPPPSQLAVHDPPAHVGVDPVHMPHAPPVDPHAVPDIPGTQLVPLQQPPLHFRPPSQLVPQSPVVVLHA